MPGWGSDATGSIKRAAQKKIKPLMSATGRLPEAKKTKRETGNVQPSKTPGAVSRQRDETEQDTENDTDNLVGRPGIGQRVSQIYKILRAG